MSRRNSKRGSAKGRIKKRYFLKCVHCDIKSIHKEFSTRWDPVDAPRCRGCSRRMTECTPPEARRMAKEFPAPPRRGKGRKKGWYATYLEGPLWATISSRVLSRDGRCCQICSGVANQVHHRSYQQDVLAGLNDAPLVSLCKECHHDIEFDESGRKVGLKEANRRLDAARKRELDAGGHRVST